MDDLPIVEARNVTRTFDTGGASVHAVKGVSLTVYRGEFVALVGPSGCGKSTLLTMLGLIERPSSGEIVIEGQALGLAQETRLQGIRRSKIGFVFQAFNLLPTLSVVENVMLPCILMGHTEEFSRSRSQELLALLGLSQRLNAMPATLSGGEMQRVAIARAIAHEPAIVLADEPTGNLDSVAGDAVLSVLSEVHRMGTPIIMVTHSDAAVARCSRVLRMHDGAIVHAG